MSGAVFPPLHWKSPAPAAPAARGGVYFIIRNSAQVDNSAKKSHIIYWKITVFTDNKKI
jgi:hypothetical protein